MQKNYSFRILDESVALAKAKAMLAGRKPEQDPHFEATFGQWHDLSEEKLQTLLFACLATPGTRQDVLRDFWDSPELTHLSTLSSELVEDVLRRNKIRMPAEKAKRIVNVRKVRIKSLLESLSPLSGQNLHGEREARLELMRQIPKGGGWKVVSLFFKTIGFARLLAILDSRNLNFMILCGLLPEDTEPQILSQKRVYYRLEGWENKLASELNLTIPELDSMICMLMEQKAEENY